jgi:hypothetical protein
MWDKWNMKKNKEETKLKCCKAVAVLTLSYGSETLTKMNKMLPNSNKENEDYHFL